MDHRVSMHSRRGVGWGQLAVPELFAGQPRPGRLPPASAVDAAGSSQTHRVGAAGMARGAVVTRELRGGFRGVVARGVVVAVAVGMILAGCAVGPPPEPPAGPDAVVADDGFTVALDDITVEGDSAVAALGTGVHLRAAPGLVPPGLKGVETGPAFDIALEGGLQPRTPVTVSFTLPETTRDHSMLFFVTQRSDTEQWEGLPVVVQDGRAIVTMTHFSGGWFGWADQVGDWFLDQVKQFLKVGFPTPDCVGQTASAGGLAYGVSADGDGVHACVSAVSDRVTTTIHSATPFVWRFRPTPGEGTGLPAIPPLDLAGMATQLLFQLQSGGSYAKETVLVPGGSASILLAEGVTETRTAARVDAGLGLVAVLIAGLDMAAAMSTGQDPTNWLEGALKRVETAADIRDMVECMAGVVEGSQDIRASSSR